MALIYAVCAFVILACVSVCVDGRGIWDSEDSELKGEKLERVKRTIMNGSAGNGCAKGAFRFGASCFTCEEIGKKRNRRTKICHGKCIDMHRRCIKEHRRKVYA